jgi:glycosyltransferase involved in cell wall biosynthesis
LTAVAERFSIIIPAHNEEAGLGRLLDGLVGCRAEVIVAANGCTDGTVTVASGHPVVSRVLTLQDASKVKAINAADGVATIFPRFVLDADVFISVEDLELMREALVDGGFLACGAQLKYSLSRASWLMRRYYRVVSEIPVFSGRYLGSGVYGLSEAGHQRVMPLPNVIADDEYVRCSFIEAERASQVGSVVIWPARDVRSFLRRSRRVRRGNAELAALGVRSDAGSSRRTLMSILRGLTVPGRVVDSVIFLSVTALARAQATFDRLAGSDGAWLRDDSSRRA